jgi:hypothetical protein
MFGGMQVKSRADGGTMAPPVPAPTPTSGSLLDFMGDDSATAAAPAPAASTNGTVMMFAIEHARQKVADSQEAPSRVMVHRGSVLYEPNCAADK